jgi:hypothetical protein
MTDLERRLHALAPEAFPPVPDVRAAVAASIAAASAGTRATAGGRASWRAVTGIGGSKRRPGRRLEPLTPAEARARASQRRRVIALALALVLVPTAAVAAVPDARHAVLDWLGLAHVRVERAPKARVPPLPALDRADLGRRVATVAEAGRRAHFAVAVPRALGTPDAVYVSAGGVVSLAYAPRPGLPRDGPTGLGLLVTELRATGIPEYVAKTAGPRTRVEQVQVGGARGVFLSGEPHELLLEQPGRMVRPLPARLAGNTLAFERGDLVLRLEAGFDREQALVLARSLRAGPG